MLVRLEGFGKDSKIVLRANDILGIINVVPSCFPDVQHHKLPFLSISFHFSYASAHPLLLAWVEESAAVIIPQFNSFPEPIYTIHERRMVMKQIGEDKMLFDTIWFPP